MTKAKSKSTIKSTAPTTPELSVAAAGNVRGLVVTLPILVAVLFTIGYVQLRTAPLTDKASSPTTRQVTQTVPAADLPALQFATPTPAKLAPLAVTVTEGAFTPTGNGIGDTNASAAAQPAVTSRLQAPPNPTHSDDNALQAPKHSDDSKELFNL